MDSDEGVTFRGRRIVVADEDAGIIAQIITALRGAGYALFRAYDARSAVELAVALDRCDLVITNTVVGGVAGPQLIREIRAHMPALPIIFLANSGRNTKDTESLLPADVQVLCEPFEDSQLLELVRTALRDAKPEVRADGKPYTDGWRHTIGVPRTDGRPQTDRRPGVHADRMVS